MLYFGIYFIFIHGHTAFAVQFSVVRSFAIPFQITNRLKGYKKVDNGGRAASAHAMVCPKVQSRGHIVCCTEKGECNKEPATRLRLQNRRWQKGCDGQRTIQIIKHEGGKGHRSCSHKYWAASSKLFVMRASYRGMGTKVARLRRRRRLLWLSHRNCRRSWCLISTGNCKINNKSLTLCFSLLLT